MKRRKAKLLEKGAADVKHATEPHTTTTMSRPKENGGARLVITGLPTSAELFLDGHSAYTTTEGSRFAGFKGLSVGLHCLCWRVSGASPVWNVFLRHFSSEDDVCLRRFDAQSEDLVVAGGGGARRRRRKVAADRPAETLASAEVLAEVAPRLIPYARDRQHRWTAATHWLCAPRDGATAIARVVGIDPDAGDAVADSMMSGPNEGEKHDARLATGALGQAVDPKRTVWGKPRPTEKEPSPSRVLVEEAQEEEHEHNEESLASGIGAAKRKRDEAQEEEEEQETRPTLQYTSFDLKRSWPKGALGADLTRWSIDKSFLLGDVIQRAGTVSVLLAEFELSFILGGLGQNTYSFEQWKRLISLFCRSSGYLGAPTWYEAHPSCASVEGSHASRKGKLRDHTLFLTALTAQLDLLASEFWSQQDQKRDEDAIVADLDALRANIGRALAARADADADADGSGDAEALVAAWRRLSHLAKNKFGWELDRRLDEEAEVEDDIAAEEGDEAPVIIEL